MTARSSTIPAYARIPTRRRRGLVSLIIGLDAGFRERRSLERLDRHRLRDVGLDKDDLRREADLPAWDVPDWWR